MEQARFIFMVLFNNRLGTKTFSVGILNILFGLKIIHLLVEKFTKSVALFFEIHNSVNQVRVGY